MRVNDSFYNFIKENANKETNSLRLKLKPENLDFDLSVALLQIESRKKYASKLKEFLTNPLFLFPDAISGEQASHQAVAKFHASLAENCRSVLDMTAGLGIDVLSFAKKCDTVTAIELNPDKAEILNENALILNLNNIEVIHDDSIKFLNGSARIFDLIFIDPARRDSSNKRVYNLHDCLPDVISNRQLLISHAEKVLIKASPLLDIAQTIKDFDNITSISAIGVKGECKEILIELKADTNNNEIILHAINLDNEGNVISKFSCIKNINSERTISINSNQNIKYLESESDLISGIYILEPSATLMKLSPWQEICHKFNARKFGPSSHLFVSDRIPVDFPGRVTKFEKILSKKDRKSLVGFPASVISRNYPVSSEEIRKTFRLKEGDKNFIYATRIGSKPIMMLSTLP